MSAQVSVVIPTRDAGPRFRETLEAVRAQRLDVPFEVIVVDSGSQDGTLDVCRAFDVRLLRIEPSRFNHGATRNEAISVAHGELVALTVQDAVPADDGWLAALVAPLREDPTVAGVYGRQVPRPEASHLARRRTVLWYDGQDARAEQRLPDPSAWTHLAPERRQEISRFDNVTSCVRRSVWAHLPFPETPYSEDVAWAVKVLKAGHAVVFEPAAKVVHSHDRSLEYELRRAYVDAHCLARILEAEPEALSATEARELLGWLAEEADAYLEASGEDTGIRVNEHTLGVETWFRALKGADATWSRCARAAGEDRPADDATLPFFLGDEAWARGRFDGLAAARLFGPSSLLDPEERAWLLSEIGWLRETDREREREVTRGMFDEEATGHLFGPSSPHSLETRCWMLGKMDLAGGAADEAAPRSESADDDEAAARRWYRERFDATCATYLLGPDSPKEEDARAWMSGELDRFEKERARMGLVLGAPLSRRLHRDKPSDKDVEHCFDGMWDRLSRDFAREAVNASFVAEILSSTRAPGSSEQRLARLHDALWDIEVEDELRDAVGTSVARRIERAVAGESALSAAELGFVFDNLWRRIGREYVMGVLPHPVTGDDAGHALSAARRAQRLAVEELCAESPRREVLTHRDFWRARLYTAAATVGRVLGLATRSRLPADGSTDGTEPGAARDRSPRPDGLWRDLAGLVASEPADRGFWHALDRVTGRGV